MKAVVFDMDGVIFDSEILVIRVWERVAERHGIEDIEATCMQCLGVNREGSRRIFMNRYGESFPYEAYQKEVRALFHEMADGGKLPQKPGIRELLLYLREQEIPTAVASSTSCDVVCRELEEGGLLDYFNIVIGGDKVRKSKPEPDIFLLACEELHVLPEDTWVIEDSYNGIRAAARAGTHPIMVPDLMEPTDEIRSLTDYVLPSLHEVKELFKSLRPV
ncbi:MAG: HAD family phosphatase [Lachnospiraceae bacterium]|nr:HAD family phosphatase [Lachnospiraceae bacterium]